MPGGRPLAVGDTCYLGHKIRALDDLLIHPREEVVRCVECVIVARAERQAILTADAQRRARNRGEAPNPGRT